MAAVIFHEPVFSTTVESGDRLYFYEVGTTTDLTVFTDYALTTPASQPVVADADGRFVPLYFDATGNDPKVVLKDSTDVEKWTCDRYPVDDLTTLTASVAANTSAISVLDGRMATAEADIDVLETESADYEARISANEAALAAGTGITSTAAANGSMVIGDIIINWGKTASIAGFSTAAITFDTPFTTAVYSITATSIKTGGLYNNSAGVGEYIQTGYSLTGATIVNDFAAASSGGVFWQAIGK